MIAYLSLVAAWLDGGGGRGEEGFSTAELLGNAALGIAALVAIWALMSTLGTDVVTWIRGQLGI